MYMWGRDCPLKIPKKPQISFQRSFQQTVTVPLVHKTSAIIIDSETRRTELMDNMSNFLIP